MSQLFEFKAVIDSYDESSMTARLVPYGEKVSYGDGTVRFEAGSMMVDDGVPLTMNHGDDVLDVIGVMTRHFETDKGLFGEFKISDVPAGQTVRALLADGALTDVSVGVLLDSADHASDVVMAGILEHVSVVRRGRFGKAKHPSKVLSVHDEGSPLMGEEKVEEVAPVVAFDDTELKAEIVSLSEQIDTMNSAVVEEAPQFSSIGDFAVTQAKAAYGDADAVHKMANFALGEETTTTGAGVVPDYLSSEYLSIIATSRAYLGNIPQDPIGTAGMSVVYPKKTSGPGVTVQAAEIDEPGSTAMPIATLSVALISYAGANRVSQQLIARSSPSFVDILFRELAGQYAQVTEAASILAGVTAAGGTAVVADLSTSASATFAAFNVANSAIITGTRKPADQVWLSSSRWAELNSLVDSDGRPLLVFGANGPMNAQGQSAFSTMVAQYHGWTVRLAVDAAAGTCLIGNSESVANLESSPTQLSAVQVDTLSTDYGIWGLQSVAVKFAAGLYTLTTA